MLTGAWWGRNEEYVKDRGTILTLAKILKFESNYQNVSYWSFTVSCISFYINFNVYDLTFVTFHVHSHSSTPSSIFGLFIFPDLSPQVSIVAINIFFAKDKTHALKSLT